MILCLNCGSHVEEGLRFCTDCGFEARPYPRSEEPAIPVSQATARHQSDYPNTQMYPPPFSQENERDFRDHTYPPFTYPSAAEAPAQFPAPSFPDHAPQQPTGYAFTANEPPVQPAAAGHRKLALIVGGAIVLIAAAASVLFLRGGPNELPSIQGIEVSQTTARRGDVIILTGTATDPDDDNLTYSWTVSGGQLLGDGPNVRLDTSTISSSASPVALTVSLSVGDGRGGTASDYRVIMVDTDIQGASANDLNTGIHTLPETPPAPVTTQADKTNVVDAATSNRPPTISLRTDRLSVHQGEDVYIYADASDRDGDALNYSWTSSAGQLIGSANRYTLKTSSIKPGQVEVTATVMDARGQTAAARLIIAIHPPPNRPPYVAQLFANKERINPGERVRLRAQAGDQDGDGLSYTWSASMGTITGSGAEVVLDTSGLNAGSDGVQIRVSVTVTDSYGATASSSKYLTMSGETAGIGRRIKAGPISVAAFYQGEDLIITLSGTPGSAETPNGTIDVTAGGAGNIERATGYIPITPQIYSFARQENVKRIAFAETPGPSNRFSRMVVRVTPKNRNQPVRFTIAWRRY